MANEEHLAKLREGIEAWNKWRKDNFIKGPFGADMFRPDLACADLREADLRQANLSGTNFCRANLSHSELSMTKLSGTNLSEANLELANLSWAEMQGADFNGANLRFAQLMGANLFWADLSRANLEGADLDGAMLAETKLCDAILRAARLQGADLSEADLSGVDLTQGDLAGSSLISTTLKGAKLDGCRIYGASVWDVDLDERTSQRDLIITPDDQDDVTVDNLKVAQFIYLLLNNEEIRHVIDTMTSKIVLILGRFTDARKQVLNAIRDKLRHQDFTPVVFDFDKPSSRDLTETISTLAHMASFVIADITDAKSIPQELQKIVPNLPSLPVRPIILENQYEYAMFRDFAGYLSVLPPYRYRDSTRLLEVLDSEVIGPALNKAQEIEERRKAFEEELVQH